jgi:hypothetical protein
MINSVMRFLRFFRPPPPPPPPISLEEAEEIAKREAERRGWEWKEPVKRTERVRAYHFFTDTRMRGGNVSVKVSSEDGSIIYAGTTPL